MIFSLSFLLWMLQVIFNMYIYITIFIQSNAFNLIQNVTFVTLTNCIILFQHDLQLKYDRIKLSAKFTQELKMIEYFYKQMMKQSIHSWSRLKTVKKRLTSKDFIWNVLKRERERVKEREWEREREREKI